MDLDEIATALKNNAEKIGDQLEEWSKWQDTAVVGNVVVEEGNNTIPEGSPFHNLWDSLEFGPRTTEKILTLGMRSRKNETLANIFKKDGKSDLWTIHSAVTQHLTDQDSELVRIRELPKVEKMFMKFADAA